MNKKLAFSRLTFLQKIILFCFVSICTIQPSSAITHHSKKVKHLANTTLGKVILTPQHANSLSIIAYSLNNIDINFAIQHNEKPLVLIGSANLSSTQTPQIVLFTQLQSASLCGSGGCTTTAYLKHNHQWIKILDSVTGNILIKKSSHNGMHDLAVEDSRLWVWNKTIYREK